MVPNSSHSCHSAIGPLADISHETVDGRIRSRAESTAWSALLLSRGRGEIGFFLHDPIDKFSNVGLGQQTLDIQRVTLQLQIGEIGDQRLLANRRRIRL